MIRFSNTLLAGLLISFIMFLIVFPGLVYSQSEVFSIESSSFIADATSNDVVNGARIQSNGNIVLAISNSNPVIGGITASVLNGARPESAGAIVRLNPAGTAVLSVTKVGANVLDLAVDASDNIYVALGAGGFVKLNSSAQSLVFHRANDGNCRRIDAGRNGSVVALNNTGSDAGKIYVYNPSGTELYNTNGKNFTQDIAINDELQLMYFIGFRNANTGCNPVQIAYMVAQNFSGAEVWRNYDWPANLLDDCDGTPKENNMADSRGYRITMGEDGKLYAAFEIAGGNHIFRYSPKSLTTSVTVVGGDAYTEFYNTRDEHKSFFARYEPSNGNYLLGQQLVARPNGPNGLGNAIRIKDGDISADGSGKVFLGGTSGDGLPLTFDPAGAGSSTGGAFLIAFSNNFSSRLFTTHISAGEVHAVFARTVNHEVKCVFGGIATEGKTYVHNPLQSTSIGGAFDANFALLRVVPDKSLPVITITAPSNNANFHDGNTITLSSSASDSDGTIARVDFYKDDVYLGTDFSSPYSYTINNAVNGSYILRAKATDNDGLVSFSPRVTVNVTVNAPNLALSKPVTFSSQQTGNESYKAVDGNVTTRWAATPFPQWMEVDLGSVTNINRTEIVCYADRAYRFKIEAKTSVAGTYSTIVNRTSNTQAGSAANPISDAFTSTSARYVKLTVTGEAGGAGWLGINEFRVFNVGTAPSNVAPNVNVTSPANNASFVAGANIVINANAADTDGAISEVEFFRGTTKLGEDVSSPYTYSWSGAPAGSYALTAVATDDASASTTSAVINIIVTPGTSYPIPGKVQAESYAAMSGVQLQTTSDTGGGKNVGYIDTGDWIDYSITVATAGIYNINYRVASPSGGGKLILRKGASDYHTVDIPPTGGWQIWTTVSASATLAAGTQMLRIYAQNGGWNINWFEGVTTNALRAAENLTSADKSIESNESELSAHPNPVMDHLYINANNIQALVLYNTQGITVLKPEKDLKHLNLSGLPAGIYWLKVTAGKETHSIKIIKQ